MSSTAFQKVPAHHPCGSPHHVPTEGTYSPPQRHRTCLTARTTLMSLVIAAAGLAMSAITTPLHATEPLNIQAAFEKSYVYRTYLQYDTIKLSAKDGIVTLSGTVDQASHQALAQETVADLPGVYRVDNQLVTKGEVPADTWISREIKLALQLHRSVNPNKTIVETKDGVVTLKGEASSLGQKELTTEYAKDIQGVIEVRNEMTVVATPETTNRTAAEKVDDASITSQVKAALWTHRSTSAMRTGVRTRDGDVTLTGTAYNAAEKALVTKLVTDIWGVRSVSNQMSVETVSADKSSDRCGLPAAKMMACCQEMKDQRQQMTAAAKAQDAELAESVAQMNSAADGKKVDLMAGIITRMVEQQIAMHANRGKTDHLMMKHMMQHGAMGMGGVSQCPMMQLTQDTTARSDAAEQEVHAKQE